MPFYICNLNSSDSVKLPERITFSGTVHVGHDGYTSLGGSGKMIGRTSVTIPTIGYQKADITISAPGTNTSSSVGTGNNINISDKNNIVLTAETGKATANWHSAYNYYFGDANGSYTVVLHN